MQGRWWLNKKTAWCYVLEENNEVIAMILQLHYNDLELYSVQWEGVKFLTLESAKAYVERQFP